MRTSDGRVAKGGRRATAGVAGFVIEGLSDVPESVRREGVGATLSPPPLGTRGAASAAARFLAFLDAADSKLSSAVVLSA